MIGPRVNPLVRDTASPAILQAREWLESYDGNKEFGSTSRKPPHPTPHRKN